MFIRKKSIFLIGLFVLFVMPLGIFMLPGSAKAAAVFNQNHFRVYQDDGALNAATMFAAIDTNCNIYMGQNFRIRFEVANTGDAAGSVVRRLKFSEDGGTYTTVTTNSNNVRLNDSANFTDAAATTTRLTATGTFVAGQGKDTGADASTVSITNVYYIEDEYSLLFMAGAAGHTYTFRIYSTDAALTTYDQTPTVIALQVSGNPIPPAPVTFSSGSPILPSTSIENPQGAFKVIINPSTSSTGEIVSQTSTASPNVNLRLLAGSDVAYMMISNTLDFKGVIMENYAQTKSWDLCKGA